ncbi:uncharacterized protein BCR38DRAFT_39686 [Pseudomassariella vexata]|uniref:Zn(2)-C6 fungal-type domain-containing protein n=1 Tax=Pseudomassariella vexata TaxID=1141098 RepID=A0A1Y2DR85_9PEZI|nr:uncharacterized protein BCR38DRAFT_39686 [Pseudomassariella vexata]ORY61798.1 hypothetical protein BCR38DRAFT_39686 [Pseudomassariella vexata]
MRRASTTGKESGTRTTNSSAQRLPVNHRRHKVAPEQRKRVSTACNSCNVRRIKCSGERPCLQCRNGSRECQYPVVVEKIAVPRTDLEELTAKCKRLEACLELAIPDEASRRDLMARTGAAAFSNSGGSTTATTTAGAPAPASAPAMGPNDAQEDESAQEGRMLYDPDGTQRYLGPTSGAAFLDLIKEFMNTMFPLAWPGSQNLEGTFLGSLGRYQTFDSQPLVVHDVDPFWLPIKTEVTVMITQLRYFVQDGSGDFLSGGIYYWGDLDPSFFDSKEPLDSSAADPRTLRQLALFHAAFAMACLLEPPGDNISSAQRNEAFFARARLLLGNPLDTNTNTVHDISVLAMMSIYLVEMNRRDAAYMYVSLGMQIAVMHGVHCGWVDELGKRTFWTLYIIDRWLSVLMGRPPAVADEAIRLAMPTEIVGLPSAVGLRAHVELAKISGYIVCNTYRIAPCPWERQTADASYRIDNALGWLTGWAAKLPPQLQLPDAGFTSDRACCELHMAYNQLLILTIRPIFFMAVKRAVAERLTNRCWSLETHPHIKYLRVCSDAARRNLRLGRWVRDLMPSRKMLLTSLHNIFNAAIILLLHQLLFDRLEEHDTQGVSFVVECFDAEATGENHYPKDCARVLRGLGSLVHRLRNQKHDGSSLGSSPTSIVPPSSQVQHPAAITAYDVGFILNPEVPKQIETQQAQQPSTAGALYHELSNWMDHDDLQLYNNYLV